MSKAKSTPSGAVIALALTAFSLIVACGAESVGTTQDGNGGEASTATDIDGIDGIEGIEGVGGIGGDDPGGMAPGGFGGDPGPSDCSDMKALCITQCDALERQSEGLGCKKSGIVADDCMATCQQFLATSATCTCEYLELNQCVVEAGESGLVCQVDEETIFNPALCVVEAAALSACTD